MDEKDERPPTLASLRASRGGGRRSAGSGRASGRGSGARPVEKAGSGEPPWMGLLFGAQSEVEEASVPEAGGGAPVVAAEPVVKAAVGRAGGLASGRLVATAVERRVWSVGELVGEVRQQVEEGYGDVWVEGEISNCRVAPSGHIYFTLKDGEAQLGVVLFRRQAMLLRFKPADGLAVLVRGRVSVYESRGQLQVIGETMEPRGAGALQLAFEQLKARLLAEGLFDAARKRALPAFPRCVGVITSPTGAVIRDIATVVRRRHARLNVLVYPATMQGANCASTVAAGVRWFNRNRGRVDVIVIARGGGSMEDLAGFNDEGLARVIAGSELPVVSAVGHETDFTIADFVADLRAATPSAAAELITAAQHRIEERVDALERRVERAGRYHLMMARQRYARLSADAVLNRLRDAVSRRDQRLDELRLRLEAAVARRLRAPAVRLGGLTDRLQRQDVSLRLAGARHRLESAKQRLMRVAQREMTQRENRLERVSGRLEALSPLAVLGRGYALVYGADGGLLRSAGESAVGEGIRVRLGSGALGATVTEVERGREIEDTVTEKGT